MPHVTAAPFPIKLGAFTYEMSPLSDSDTEVINNWLRASYIQMARDSLTPKSTEVEREETLRIAMTTARKLSFMEGDGAEIISSLEGVTRVLWQSIRRKHPEVSWELFRQRVWELKDLSEAELSHDISTAMSVWKEINVGKVDTRAASEKPASTGASRAEKKRRRREKKRSTRN